MERVVLLLSTLDTKGPETFYLRDSIKTRGGACSILDMSMSGEFPGADITSSETARAAGADIEDIRVSKERKKITRQMISGATKIATDLMKSGRLGGVIGLGGSTGSLMATDVMRALPFGVPKLMVSSTAALPGLATRYIGTGDIAVLHTVIEISGLSKPLMNLLDRAAAAITGMATVDSLTVQSSRDSGVPLVAMSMFGPTERCSHTVRQSLESSGYQVIGFSAAGICDRAMEEMISEGFFDAVVELAPGGVGEEYLGGMRAAGANRLTSAAKIGIPQVIAPGGVNLTSPRKSRYKPEHHERRKFELDELRTFLRVSDEEIVGVAKVFAEKLNQAKGPTIILFPTQGWSAVDPPSGHMFDRDQDRLFLMTLKEALLSDHVTIREVNANLEEQAFAKAVASACLEIFPKSLKSQKD
ncbi:MAG: Tm-1-like ATP-binding domain-containing protein [Desulfomonilaceae bacterium]